MEEKLYGSVHRQKSPGTVQSAPGVPDPALQLEGVSLQLRLWEREDLTECTTQQVLNM